MKKLLTFCLLLICVQAFNAQSSLLQINLFEQTAYDNNQSAADGLVIFFQAGSNNAVDNFDAPKFFNLDETFARQNGSNLLSIERRDLPVDNEFLPFYNINYRSSDYVYVVDAFQIPDFLVFFKDSFTGQIYEIGTGSEQIISFSVDSSVPESEDVNRFGIFSIEKSDYIHDNAWITLDPCVNSITAVDNLNILSGTAVIDCDINVKNLTISQGASLEIAAGRSLTVNGDVMNAGTFIAQNASITVSNSSTLYSNISKFSDVIIDDNSSVVMNGNFDIYGTIRHSGTGAAAIDNKNGQLTLKSTATSNAFYLPTNLTISAPVISEAYMSAGRAFRFLSSPVTTSSTIFENWQENGDESIVGFGIDITGSAGAAGGFDLTATNNPSMFKWDNIGQSWVAQSSTNNLIDILEAGQPYRLFVRGDRQVDLTSNADAQRATILRATGTLKTGDHMPVVSNVNGTFNLIGNPYAAPYDLDGMLSNLNISGNPVDATGTVPTFFYVWDPNLQTRGAYVTYDTQLNLSLNSTSEVNGFLQPYQSAFVIANGTAGGFTFKESYLDVNQSYVQVTANPQMMRMELLQNQEVKDGAIVKFSSSYSNQIDVYDAPKINNLEENFSVLQSSNLLSINARDLPTHGEQLQLYLSQLSSGSYDFAIAPVTFNGLNAFLKDTYTGQSVLLDDNMPTIYSFTYDVLDPLSSDASRFHIEFENSTLSVDESAFAKAISLHPNPMKNGTLTIHMHSDLQLEHTTVLNVLGQRLKEIEGSHNNKIDLSSLSTGIYVLKLYIDNQVISKKIIIE